MPSANSKVHDPLINKRRDRALKNRLRKRSLEGWVYRRLWGRDLPQRYPELNPDRLKRILILQRDQRIGDLVVTMAITAGLRNAIPHVHIATLVPQSLTDLAAVDQAVDEVIPQSVSLFSDLHTIRCRQWDMVAVLGIQSLSLQLAKHSGATWQLGYSYNHRGDNLNRALLPHHSCHRSGWEYSPQSAPHIVDFWTEMFRRAGIAIEPGAWQLNLPDVSQPVGDMFGREYRGPKIGLHPFSGNPIRNWLLGRFAILGRQLQYTWGAHLVITGGAVDSRSARWLAKTIGGHCTVTAGKIGLIDTWSALRELDLVISVDTGMIHMAAALDIPVVSLFGPGDPAIWGPHRQLNRVIQCFPNCQRCKGGHCVQPRIYCMEAISVDHVLDKVQEILRKEPVVSTVGT